ncbi:MAG: response regulator [Myxococcales bacterium]|nr:response regulator [Myxococcales bacterium]
MPTVLIVDDSPTQRVFCAMVLEEGGYDLLEAESAEDARNLLQGLERLPDMVLSDVSMPGQNGFEFCAWIKQHHPELSVSLLTSPPYRESVVAALSAGADTCLLKPFQSDHLLHHVECALSTKSVSSQQLLTALVCELATRLDEKDKG